MGRAKIDATQCRDKSQQCKKSELNQRENTARRPERRIEGGQRQDTGDKMKCCHVGQGQRRGIRNRIQKKLNMIDRVQNMVFSRIYSLSFVKRGGFMLMIISLFKLYHVLRQGTAMFQIMRQAARIRAPCQRIHHKNSEQCKGEKSEERLTHGARF